MSEPRPSESTSPKTDAWRGLPLPRTRRAWALLGVVLVAIVAGMVIHVRSTPALGQRCGTILSGGVTPGAQSDADVQRAVGCFAQAYAQCTAASLVGQNAGVDTGAERTFIVVPPRSADGKCGLVVEWSIGGPDVSSRSGEEICAGLRQDGGTLTLLHCGSLGDIIIPPGF